MYEIFKENAIIIRNGRQWQSRIYKVKDRLAVYFQDGYYYCSEEGNMTGERVITENKIRFIDSNYNELFKINDGGEILITLANGKKIERQCFYLDETHFKIGGEIYHICQFAEIMEHNGNKREPVAK